MNKSIANKFGPDQKGSGATSTITSALSLQPHYKDNFVTLFQGDCRDILPRLNLESAFCWTDCPFNVGKPYRGGPKDDLDDAEYLKFASEWIHKVRRCCSEMA